MAITLAQLRARVQILYDITGSAILSDPEWNQLVNDGIRAMWADVTRINKDFRVTTVGFVLTTVQFTALAADFREIRAVRLNPGTQSQIYLQKQSMRNGSQTFTRSYRLQGTSLYIEPLQNIAGTYDYVYIPQAPVLAADGDLFDAELEQFQDYVVYHAVIASLSREESDIGQSAQLMAAAQSALVGWASDQRSADPDTVEDVRRRPTFLWAPP
jgi:hypothetical protein